MRQNEITIFLILSSVIALIFLIGSIIYIAQYRKRKLAYQNEKAMIEKQHNIELLDAKVRMQQQTMEDIGREIHDNVSQNITLASIYAQKLEIDNGQNEISERLKLINTLLSRSLLELRDLSRSLTDVELLQKSLTELLQRLCESINSSGICKAELTGTYNEEIDPSVKRHLYRVMQEFAQNSLKHSGCHTLTIQLELQNDGLAIIATDDGKGFDLDKITRKGIGLENIQRRINMIGGESRLQSKFGVGTSLKLFIDRKVLKPRM